MATSTTATPPAVTSEPAALPPISEAPETFVTDGSRIADRAKYLDSFERLGAALLGHVEGVKLTRSNSEMGAIANLDLRESIVRGDNGAVDWAANTAAYSYAFQTQLARFAKEHSLSDEQVETYRSNVRRWMADNNAVQVRMTLWAAANDSTLKAVRAETEKAASERGKIPTDVKKVLRKELAKQTAKNGKVLAGFETAIADFGPRKKGSGGGNGAGNTGKITPEKAWGILRSDVAKLAPDVAAEELHHLVTNYIDSLVGPKGEKIPTAKAGRKKAIETLAVIERQIHATLAVFDGKGEKDAISEHAWSEQ